VTGWQLLDSSSDVIEDAFFAQVARSLVELTGARAAVIVAAEDDRGTVLTRFPEQADAPTELVLAESPFAGLPLEPGLFRAPAPAVLCGIPIETSGATLLGASSEAVTDRRVIVGLVVADEDLARVSPRALASFAVRTAARLAAFVERDTELGMRRYRRVAEAIGEVVWELDLTTGTIDWSGPMNERFRFDLAKITSDVEWWKSNIHPDDYARVTASFEAACAGKDASWTSTYRFVRGDGSVAYVRDRCFITRDADGRAVQAAGSLQDISELHDLEQRLVLADRMASIGTLAAGLAHEINNPLTYILGNLDIVLTALDAPASDYSRGDLLQMLREAHQGAMRVSEIVRSMRVFARSEPATSKVADLDRVVDSALAMAKNEIRHRARLHKNLGGPVMALANETTLVQVVLNLLMNAVQAIPEGQADRFEIAVTTGLNPDGRGFIEVRDTGEGMTAETMRRAFDPFFTTKQVGQGRGLGLSLVHSAVTACGGDVRVTSAVGKGSTFRLILPLSAETAPRPRSGVVASEGRLRILIVDDEAPVVRVLRRMLVRDHDVIVAASGTEALEILRQDPEIDVVLCDVMMPDLTGADLHRQLVTEMPAVAERFVFVTGGAFGERARAYVQSTIQPSITKPFRNTEVAEAIQLVCRRRRTEGRVA